MSGGEEVMAVRTLRVDVSSGRIQVEEVPEEVAFGFIGGRGLNSWRLFWEVGPGVEPLSDQNRVYFAIGPLDGIPVLGSRFNVSSKSPMTGLLGDSNAGGHFGAEMRFAGWDQIVIEGASCDPVYILVQDEEVSIRPARHLWGKDTWQVQALIREELGDEGVQVACVGPAAERGVVFAGVFCNLVRAAARTGMGAVLGAKKVKALAVRGTGALTPRHPERAHALLEQIRRYLINHPDYASRRAMGTTRLVSALNALGILATRHFRTGYFEAAARVSGERLAAEYNVASRGCFGCAVPCSRWFRIRSGTFRGLEGEGPEFESLAAFTARVGNDDLDVALKAIDLCNRYGMDTLTVAECISLLMELHHEGLLDGSVAGSLDLGWGNSRTILTLVEQIGRREGLGELFAAGPLAAARQLGRGAEEYVMHVKGLPLIQADPRGLKGYGLGFCVATRGGDHLRAEPYFELSFDAEEARRRFGVPQAGFPGEYLGKGKLVRYSEELCAVCDSLDVCKNTMVCMEAVDFQLAARLLEAVCGWSLDAEAVRKVGERIVNLERAYLVREGVDRRQDRLPSRFLETPLPAECGASAGLTFELEEMLDEYYRERGWDRDRGWPTRRKLEELDLGDVEADLRARGLVLRE